MSARLDRVCWAVLGSSAAYFGLGVLWPRSANDLGVAAFDYYSYFHPNQLYGWRSVREGAGLLWNPYQDCGQPFFAVSQVGMLYPVNVIFALLDREAAFIASAMVNVLIAGIGTFQLCRVLALPPIAALCGALAFQLGWAATGQAAWSPIHIAPLAWMPVAMWRTECLVRAPGGRTAILLGVVLAVQLLPGFPQTAYYTWQLIGLRVLWALAAGCGRGAPALLGATALALVLALGLAAAQVVPSWEFARESVRGASLLDSNDLGPSYGGGGWRKAITTFVGSRGTTQLLVMATLALLTPKGFSRSSVAFYVVVAATYLVLSAGPTTILFDLYMQMPLGQSFRGAWRLLWCNNLALAVLTAFGANVLLGGEARQGRAPTTATDTWRRRLLPAVPLLAAAGLQLASGRALRWSEWAVFAALSGAAWLASWPRTLWLARSAVVLAIFAGTALLGDPLYFGLRHGDLYYPRAEAFRAVRERLTPQDRVHIMGPNPSFAMMPKSASLFRVASLFDYETQAPRTYADYFTFMRAGHRVTKLKDWYWVFGELMPPTFERRLLDLAAGRYVMVDEFEDRTQQVLKSGVRLVTQVGAVRLYENEQALPRARFVPRAELAAEGQVLELLATGTADPRAVAWVSQAPSSGFLGNEESAGGTAEIVHDGAERLVVRVQAGARGFLFLADQYFPGWSVHVNGEKREILRANHTFRLVEVPQGDSEVVFTYRPWSVRVGFVVSLASALIVAWAALERRRRGAEHEPVAAKEA